MTPFLVIAGIPICWIAYKNDTLNFKYYLNLWQKILKIKIAIIDYLDLIEDYEKDKFQ